MAILKSGQTIGVCVHHSAVKPAAKNLTELKARAKSYNTSHSKKSWAETIKTKGEFGYPYIEYHYMIAYDGSLLQVQNEQYVLYHAGDSFRGTKSFNLHGIAVMLDGNYEDEKPNDKQMLTLVKLIRDVERRYKINALVRGHKETSANPTACPGKNIGTSASGWLKQVIANVNDKNYPPIVKPPTPPVNPCLEIEKKSQELERENLELTNEIGKLVEENDNLIKKYNGVVLERQELVSKLSQCKIDLEQSRENFIDKIKNWVGELLEAVTRSS
jgi:hypothetical protein